MTENQLPHHHDHHRPSRGLVFVLGLALGLLVGSVGESVLADSMRPSTPGWNTTTLICTGRSETGFFVRNSGPKDYRLTDPRQFVLMQLADLGLVASDAKVQLPVFIPQGEVAQILVDPMPAGELVLFDLGHRLKLLLK